MPIAVRTEEERARLGTKWTCGACGVRFYDLHRTPTTCPKCGQVQDELTPETPKKKSRKSTRKKATKKAAKPRKRPKAQPALGEEPEPREEAIELKGHQLGDDIATDAD
ncbi:MAG: FYDLN acid domain-containing protein [Myxococcales bacterium]|nr:FYDLN acid domain-containing protein [Myxococcales bacterium]